MFLEIVQLTKVQMTEQGLYVLRLYTRLIPFECWSWFIEWHSPYIIKHRCLVTLDQDLASYVVDCFVILVFDILCPHIVHIPVYVERSMRIDKRNTSSHIV